ncbi:MAG: glycosyltransferase [Pirellulales bacterium]|nr:glycosyltransferase [Pirellulales bacterium]
MNSSPDRIVYLSRMPEATVGGIATLWRHVRLLNEAGFHAVAAFPEGMPLAGCPVPSIYEAQLRAGDGIVFPEAWRARLIRLQGLPATKVVFVQNHFLLEHGLGGAKDYGVFGVSHAMACSQVIADALGERCGYQHVAVVRCGVDSELFRPRQKRPAIAYMPRKRPLECVHILGRFRWRFPEFQHVPIVEITNRPMAQVAEILGQAAVFLSLSHLEGLGLPPLEAMAAGALVVGFHGEGGREYATPDNGLWVDEGQLDACVTALGRALQIAIGEPETYEQMLAGGRQTAARFSPEAERRALVEFWSDVAPAARRTNS